MRKKLFPILLTCILMMGLIPSISLATPVTDKQSYIDSKSQE